MLIKADKRNALCEAALYLTYQQGFNLTTLADIAEKAGVPLGNVYYYFKTKEAIGEAVLESRAKELKARLQSFELHADYSARLSALLHYEVEQAEYTAKSGCPLGSLCQELAKQGGTLADSAAQLLDEMLRWCEKQFHGMNYSHDAAQQLARQFIAQIQGAALITNAFKDPKVMIKMAAVTEDWLKALRSEQHVKIRDAA